MIQERRRATAVLLGSADLIAVAVALFIAWFIRQTFTDGVELLPLFPLVDYAYLLIIVLPCWLISAHLFGLYRFPHVGARPGTQVFFKILSTTVVMYALTNTAIFGLHLHWVSRLWLGAFAATSFLLVCASHGAFHLVRFHALQNGKRRHALLVGAGPHAIQMARRIEAHPEWGLEIIGYLSVKPNDPSRVRPLRKLPYMGSVADLAAALEAHVVDEAILAADRAQLRELERCSEVCEEHGVPTRIFFNAFPRRVAKVAFEDWDGLPLLTLDATPTNLVELGVKRVFDITISFAVLALVSPLMLLLSVLIKLTSRGPILFSQVRVGLNGRQFKMHKFRSMLDGAEEQQADLAHLNEADGPVFKCSPDPRVTSVGRLMRRLCLDELPQFINVFKGEMSVVGPRPPLPDEVAEYERWQMRRLSVRPGITCTWQISPERNRIAFHEWIRMDLDYIDNWSFWLDLKLIARTIPVVLVGRGL